MSDLQSKFLALATQVPSEIVDVPGVGAVEVRGLTVSGRDQWFEMINAGKGKHKNVRASLLALCMHEDGKRIFSDAEASEIGTLPPSVVDKIFEVASRLSGLGDQGETEGNSESAR